MSVARKLIFFLSLLALAVCGGLLLAGPSVALYGSVLQNGWGTDSYEAAAVGSDNLAAAVGWTDDGLTAKVFTTEGKTLREWDTVLPGETGGTVASLYPCREDLILLGLYNENASDLSLYRLTADGGVDLLMQEECRGRSYAERMDGTRLSAFSQDGGSVSFVLLSDGEATAYSCDEDDGGLVELGRTTADGVQSAAVLPDGTMALGGKGFLTLDGQSNPAVGSQQLVTNLTRTDLSLYYVDGADLSVYYSDLTGSSVRWLLSLDDAVDGHQLTSLSLASGGNVLLLLDGHTLCLAGESGVTTLHGVLYPTAVRSAVMLAVLCLAAVVLAGIVWYAACGRQRGWVPMALQWGCFLVALALVSGMVLQRSILLPQRQRETGETYAQVVDSAVQLALTEGNLSDETLPETLAHALEEVQGGVFRDVAVTAAQKSSRWYLSDGRRAELSPDFDGAQADEAAAKGWAWTWEGGQLRCCFGSGDRALTVTLRPAAAESGGGSAIGAAIALVTLAAVIILLRIGWNLRTLTKAAAHLTDGTLRLQLRSGDELAGMANTLTSTAVALARRHREREEMEQSYRRFVPEQVLTLLGKRSIREVDKGTFVSRHTAVMMVWFQFPDPVYTQAANSRLLFDSVNQVIERTASLATQNGGTVFHFSYDGYDVVMENDNARVISTAVAIQQEVLAFNEARAREGLPTVTFHIALDEGDVMMGVVGDSTRMEPTTISTCFSVVRELVNLSGRLEAQILCTESMIAGAEQYGSRYLGKCWLDGSAIRVYEIFDGDEYGTRKGKAQTVQQFTQGVFALYSGETAQAKRTFLELVHDNPTDGGARYYLYLADRMEREPDLPCSLNPPEDRRRET